MTTDLTCASCHDPHGNGQYRILKPSPDGAPNSVTQGSTTPVYINDVPLAGSYNYTTANYGTGDANGTTVPFVGSAGQSESALNVAANSGANGPNGSVADNSAMQYVPKAATTLSSGFYKGSYVEASTRWCSTCHTRYMGFGGSAGKPRSQPGHRLPGDGRRHRGRDLQVPPCHPQHRRPGQPGRRGRGPQPDHNGSGPGCGRHRLLHLQRHHLQRCGRDRPRRREDQQRSAGLCQQREWPARWLHGASARREHRAVLRWAEVHHLPRFPRVERHGCPDGQERRDVARDRRSSSQSAPPPQRSGRLPELPYQVAEPQSVVAARTRRPPRNLSDRIGHLT